MKLDGSQTKQLTEALMSAYPSQEKLEQFLLIAFEDKNLNKIAMGDNLETIVFRLIEDANAKGWLTQLIQQAYEYNPGNPDLQKFTLSQILTPCENQYLQEMKQAFLACCPQEWHDWVEDVDSLKKIFEQLQQLDNERVMLNEKTSDNQNVQFVKHLLLNETISTTPLKDSLEQWLKHSEPSFFLQSWLEPRKKEKKVSSEKHQSNIPTNLIIRLVTSSVNQRKRYLVSAWFVPDGRNHKIDLKLKNYEGYIPLQVGEKEDFSLKEIPLLIEEYFKEIKTKGYQLSSSTFTIVFFVPFKLLKEPIDCLKCQKIEGISIGAHYNVVIRHNKRSTNFEEDWRKKWESLEKKVRHSNTNTLVYRDGDHRELYTKLPNNSKIICIKLLQPPSKEVMEVIEQKSVPVIVLLRKNVESSSYQEEVQKLRKGPIAGLINRIKEKRTQAINDNTKQHIGHHLTLLWENPYLLPPDTNFAYSNPKS
ncbi:MAG: effector-associated domain EAD1-containing protein [Scytonema sp. PMC 1070.18]|nr:effector-associated domain EAD1-containing protein [Scytonema sp. PMC 1070.18]